MNVAVFGAAGPTGQQVVQQALERGWSVGALVRGPDGLGFTHERLSVVRGDARDESAVASSLEDAQAVISVLGLKKNVAGDTSLSDATATICRAMQAAGVRRLVVMSVLGLRDSAAQAGIFGRVIIPVFLKKAMSDRVRLEELVEESGLDYTLVRATRLSDGEPTGTYSAGPEVRAKISSKVTRADVARCLLDEAGSDAEHSHAIGVIG